MAVVIPIPIPMEGKNKSYQVKDAVFKFSNFEDAELSLTRAISQLLEGPVEFDLEYGDIRYTRDGKKKKDRLELDFHNLKDSCWVSLVILDDDGHANLFEMAVAEKLSE